MSLRRDEHPICRLAEEAAGADDPEEALQALRSLRDELEELERSRVKDALGSGSSFGAVARAMNISRQAAHRRYRDLVPAPVPRLALSSHARRAVQLAREEAQAMDAPALAGEHLLLGVLRSGGPTARALEAEGVTADAARACLVPGEDDVSGRALLARAAGIAAARDATEVEADHLVLAALSDPHGGATRAITALGVTPAAVRGRLGC